jgi:hypothetical protein
MVKFPFRIGKAFLDYRWHPITIPKAHYKRLEQEGLAVDSVSIDSPFGATHGKIYYGRAGYGPFYQIQMHRGNTHDPMTEFKLGQIIAVELEKVEKLVSVALRIA